MMFGSGMNLVTTIIGFGMSTTFIVFVCTRLICGRLRRLEAQQLIEMDSRIDLDLPQHRINGLEQIVVDAIPTMKFNNEAFSSMEDIQCTICLTEYKEKEVLRIMPKCGHSFHLSCIDPWLRKQSTCPICRLSIQPTGEAKHVLTDGLSTSPPFESSQITVERSPQSLLPVAATRSEGNANDDQMHRSWISNEFNSEISPEAPPRL